MKFILGGRTPLKINFIDKVSLKSSMQADFARLHPCCATYRYDAFSRVLAAASACRT
jgi:hypothetical protein